MLKTCSFALLALAMSVGFADARMLHRHVILHPGNPGRGDLCLR